MDLSLENKRILDKEYVSEIIGQPIKSFTTSEGSKQGDNVTGKLLALEVELEDDSKINIVIKSVFPLVGDLDFQTILTGKFYTSLEIFPVEIKYYSEVRPLLQELSGFPMDKPKYLSGTVDGVNDYVCLEDLRPKGYKMADKFKGLTLTEVNAVLEKLALLHAHSYAATRGGSDKMLELLKLDTGIGGHVWGRELLDLDQHVFFNAIITKMVEITREQGDTQAADKMERFAKIGHQVMMDLWKKTGVPDGGKPDKYFKVIIHGDMHVNNALFKYSENVNSSGDQQVEDVVFIDFQQCRFGNIYEDLQYFIFTSTSAEFRKQHLRSCLQHYTQQFIKVIESLPEPVALPIGYSDEEVIATFYENIEYGFSYNLVGIPFQLGIQVEAPAEKAPPPNSPPPQQLPSATEMALMHAEGLKHATKNSPVAMQRLKEMVKEMQKLNVLF